MAEYPEEDFPEYRQFSDYCSWDIGLNYPFHKPVFLERILFRNLEYHKVSFFLYDYT